MKQIYVLFFLFFLSAYYVFAQGIGISPSYLEISVLRNSENRDQFKIFNPTDHNIDFYVHNDEFSDWFEFSPNSGTIIPGSNQDIKIKVDIDSFVANGNYDSLIIIDVGTDQEQDVALNIGTAIKTRIKVTGKQIIDLVIGEISVESSDVRNPVTFGFDVLNNGNVAFSPKTYIIIKKGDYVIDRFEEQLDLIEPGKRKQYDVDWKGGIGDYKAQISIFVNDDLIKKSVVDFNIINFEEDENLSEDKTKPEEYVEKSINPHFIGMGIMISIIVLGFSLFLNLK